MMQSIRCICGKVFAACVDGMQDDEWDLEVGRYIRKGCTSQLEESVTLEGCECPDSEELHKTN